MRISDPSHADTFKFLQRFLADIAALQKTEIIKQKDAYILICKLKSKSQLYR